MSASFVEIRFVRLSDRGTNIINIVCPLLTPARLSREINIALVGGRRSILVYGHLKNVARADGEFFSSLFLPKPSPPRLRQVDHFCFSVRRIGRGTTASSCTSLAGKRFDGSNSVHEGTYRLLYGKKTYNKRSSLDACARGRSPIPSRAINTTYKRWVAGKGINNPRVQNAFIRRGFKPPSIWTSQPRSWYELRPHPARQSPPCPRYETSARGSVPFLRPIRRRVRPSLACPLEACNVQNVRGILGPARPGGRQAETTGFASASRFPKASDVATTNRRNDRLGTSIKLACFKKKVINLYKYSD